MTNQEKKAWLKQYCELDKVIDQKIAESARLRSMCEKVTTTFSDMPKGGGSDTKDNAYIKLIMLRDEIGRDIDNYVDMRNKIEAVINTVESPTLRVLLRKRYISGLTWEKIAVEMNYSYMQICRLHGKALEKAVITEEML